jgi:hypothetical protein
MRDLFFLGLTESYLESQYDAANADLEAEDCEECGEDVDECTCDLWDCVDCRKLVADCRCNAEEQQEAAEVSEAVKA